MSGIATPKTLLAAAICTMAVFATSGGAVQAASCKGADANGMGVSDTQKFGFDTSGFLVENYAVAQQAAQTNGLAKPDVVLGWAPVPKFTRFSGYRIMDCRTGLFVAIGDPDRAGSLSEVLSHWYLKDAVAKHRQIDVTRLRQAVEHAYSAKNRNALSPDTQIFYLHETSQTCSCQQHFPDLWNVKLRASTKSVGVRKRTILTGTNVKKEGTGQW